MSTVYTVARYANTLRERDPAEWAKYVRRALYKDSLDHEFPTRELAVEFIIQRGKEEVMDAERVLKRAEKKLAAVKRKFAKFAASPALPEKP